MKVNITKGQLKQLIKEEVNRMSSDEDIIAGAEMADSVISDFSQLSEMQRHAFLTKFISFLTENNAWLNLIKTLK